MHELSDATAVWVLSTIILGSGECTTYSKGSPLIVISLTINYKLNNTSKTKPYSISTICM